MQDSSTALSDLNDLNEGPFNIDDNESSVESVDRRTVSLLRLLLATAALLITVIDPGIPERLFAYEYFLLIAYFLYSLFLCVLVLREAYLIPVRAVHWLDVGWYVTLVALSNGSGSIFFFLFFFAILVASFRSGYWEGVYVTVASAVLFIVVGYFTSPSGEAFELNRFLIRPLYLLAFGYMMATWGGRELKFRRRLTLLRDVNRLSNPRFGISRTLQSIISKVRAFYDADSCLLIAERQESPRFKIWRDYRQSAERHDPDDELLGARLSDLTRDRTILYAGNKTRLFQKPVCFNISSETGQATLIDAEPYGSVAEVLHADSFIAVPVFQHEELIGRLFLSSNQRPFDLSDVSFLRQLVEQVLPGIENVQLLDRLASHAAERQRQTTSRDIHDSTIQPYIGLKLGLEAIHMKAESGHNVEHDIAKLITLADTTIADLRGFVKKLKNERSNEVGSVLVTAVRQQALKYKEFYGIDVQVEAVDGFRINDRLAAEVFQITTEALSNIRRHTTGKDALVWVRQKGDVLILLIENGNHGRPVPEFVPKSIFSRAKALGGKASVERSNTYTRVIVEIPM